MHDKPVNPACVRNQGPIEAALSSRLPAGTKVLALGSGTGNPAVYIAEHRPDLVWQASEQADHMVGLLETNKTGSMSLQEVRLPATTMAKKMRWNLNRQI